MRLVQDMGIPVTFWGGTHTRTHHGYVFEATGTGTLRVLWEYNKKHAKNLKFRVFGGLFDL